MPRTRKPAPSTLGQQQLDAAVALFRATPSATNWVKLITAMTARQDEYNLINAERERRIAAERRAHEEEIDRISAGLRAMRAAGVPIP